MAFSDDAALVAVVLGLTVLGIAALPWLKRIDSWAERRIRGAGR
jgi:hypothetical protein